MKISALQCLNKRRSITSSAENDSSCCGINTSSMYSDEAVIESFRLSCIETRAIYDELFVATTIHVRQLSAGH